MNGVDHPRAGRGGREIKNLSRAALSRTAAVRVGRAPGRWREEPPKTCREVLKTLPGAMGQAGRTGGFRNADVASAVLPPARWKRGRATRCEPAGRALWCARFHPLGLRAREGGAADGTGARRNRGPV